MPLSAPPLHVEQTSNVASCASMVPPELTVTCSRYSVFTTDEEQRFASGAPAFWKPILGPASRRQQVLTPSVNWNRTLFIRSGSEIAGYLQFYMRGDGPHDPSYRDFAAVFGVGEACFRFLLYKVMSYRFQRFEAYAYRVIVKEPYRGCGVGRCLMLSWLDLIKAQGIRQVTLEVWSDNPRAYVFYLRLGFRVVRWSVLHRSLRWFMKSYPIKMVYDF
ncbi:GNAT family N-acetyltransferase [Halomonas sp. SIMBA_159]